MIDSATVVRSCHPILVSACLLGAPCRYDGRSRLDEEISGVVARQPYLPVCPEMLAGMGSPRSPMEFRRRNGSTRLITREERDVTRAMQSACRRIVDSAVLLGCREAICKEGSPSCGVHRVHMEGESRPGRGMLVSALLRRGISVLSEEDYHVLGNGIDSDRGNPAED
jgi:uncharacterized protein YbbK (DUF523 family)